VRLLQSLPTATPAICWITIFWCNDLEGRTGKSEPSSSPSRRADKSLGGEKYHHVWSLCVGWMGELRTSHGVLEAYIWRWVSLLKQRTCGVSYFGLRRRFCFRWLPQYGRYHIVQHNMCMNWRSTARASLSA
jgi:hypothetical protein